MKIGAAIISSFSLSLFVTETCKFFQCKFYSLHVIADECTIIVYETNLSKKHVDLILT